MLSFAERLRTGPPLLLDGAMGTQLMARGLVSGRPPEAWVLDRPELVARVHAAYVAAGSEALHTCSFGANRARLTLFGLDGRLERVNREAVRLAREAGAAYVLGDIGPTGEGAPSRGEAQLERWRHIYAEQAAVLAEAGVDALHLETQYDLREARVALDAVRRAAPGLPVLLSGSFTRDGDGYRTFAGDSLADFLGVPSQADALGANCTLSSGDMVELVRWALERASEVVRVVQPNAGQPDAGQPDAGQAGAGRYPLSPEDFARDMVIIAGMGVRLLGGCCGTTPEHIRRLREALGPG